MTVVPIRKPLPQPQPAPPLYAKVTDEQRMAAATLATRAVSIQRALGRSFATTYSVSALPKLIAEARAALDELERP